VLTKDSLPHFYGFFHPVSVFVLQTQSDGPRITRPAACINSVELLYRPDGGDSSSRPANAERDQ
jgi:hypothetical protein